MTTSSLVTRPAGRYLSRTQSWLVLQESQQQLSQSPAGPSLQGHERRVLCVVVTGGVWCVVWCKLWLWSMKYTAALPDLPCLALLVWS